MPPLPRNKEVTLTRIAYAVLQLEEKRGHLKWKVNELARRSQVSRSLIYDYLGSSKREILVSALRHFAGEFYGFGQFQDSRPFAERVKNARQKMIQFPEAVVFYQRWRSRKSWLQNEFIAIEEEFQKSLRLANPELSGRQVLALYVFIHGLVTAPFLSSAQAREICQGVERGEPPF